MQITGAQKEFGKILKLKNLREYHYLYVQSYTLLLADLFENFWNMCLETNKLASPKFISAVGLA